MRYLLTPSGKKILESLSFTQTLYAFDFDGTLAPIVATPNQAKPLATTCSLIKAIATKLPVAIISGRSVADLRKRLGISIPHLIGNHGIEGLSLKNKPNHRAQIVCQEWRDELAKSRSLRPPVFVEDKVFTLAIHYRNAPNKKDLRRTLFEEIEHLDPPPRVILGKCVMNLIPPGAPHKGIALLQLMMQLQVKCAFYVGDDDTDEDVFSLPDARVVTVRVGNRKSSQAQFFLKRQSEINQLLKQILKFSEARDVTETSP